MKYNELLNAIACRCVIIIEDDFRQADYKKELHIYYFTRMAVADRISYLEEINNLFPELAEQIRAYLDLVDKYFDNVGRWDDVVPIGDILPAFEALSKEDMSIKEALSQSYLSIDNDKLQEVFSIGMKYGVGLIRPAYFDSLFDEYIFLNNRAQSIRVYSDFSASTKAQFERDLTFATDETSVACIIDNNLAGTNRAKEIIDTIANISKTERKNIVGCILSSKEEYEEINDTLYFEFVSKGAPEKLETSIAKSAYNYFISRLENETIRTLQNAFNHAISNKNIAYYLSRKALKEGASEYQIIMDWIKLMSRPQNESKTTIKNMIALSRVINNLDEDDEYAEIPDPTLEKLNTLEAFDYTVNDYNLPPMPGDIFTNDAGQWFVLIGQDCDMARRGDGSPPKNSVAELLEAKICPQSNFKKWARDLEKVSISSFRRSDDTPSEIFQVYYQKRRYISNEIINLCCFNNDGQCCLKKTDALDETQRKLLPGHMIDYYEKLQNYYQSVSNLKNALPNDLETVLGHAFSPRLISFDDFETRDGQIHFDLKRVCRLTHSYVFYLYKLYLEYRGRQPFESINLVRQEELTIPITKNGQATEFQMTFLCILSPTDSKTQNMLWYVERDELNRVLSEIGFDGVVAEDQYIKEKTHILPIGKATVHITKMAKKVDFKIV